MTDFRDQAVIVTGGASGMGRLSALALAARGAKVAIFDVVEEKLQETAAEAENIYPYRCDIANWQEVQQTARRVWEEHGPVQRLTHAAAIMPNQELAQMSAEEIVRINDINYSGTVYMVKAVLPEMLERRSGDIILFGSIAGHVLAPNMGAYSASKAAVNLFGEQLMRENIDSGLRIVVVQPPATNTPLIQQALDTSASEVLRMGAEQGSFAKPEFIVEEIEKFIESRGSGILRPGFSAKWLSWMRFWMPAMQWRMVLMAERNALKKKAT